MKRIYNQRGNSGIKFEKCSTKSLKKGVRSSPTTIGQIRYITRLNGYYRLDVGYRLCRSDQDMTNVYSK